ncbi:MAG: hypothetical protein E7555_08765 [Ruminococcaceae bacterium]|nr:hypothetical protein [Oscillospiraceae bacterium]
MKTVKLPYVLAREIKIYEKTDAAVPEILFENIGNGVPDELADICEELPSQKSSYTCFAKTDKALWIGADNGLTRYEPDAEYSADKVMLFSAERYLADNKVLSVYAPDTKEESVWVLTETAVSHIRLCRITAEEKARRLTEETHKYIDRYGLVTQRYLTKDRDPDSRLPYGHSDNSGAFTAAFAMGELFKYAYYREKYGKEHPLSVEAKKSAVRATEACQLLMHISCRDNGFVARTFLTPDEPVPDDGLFYRVGDGKAVCLPTTDSKKHRYNGRVIPAVYCVPKRLAHLYEDEGHTIEGIVYKGDTSSDEITPHYMLMYFAHLILGEEDPELDEIIKTSAKNTLRHIIGNGNRLMECFGKPTSWGRWDKKHFRFGIGWADAPLKTAELLMYHKVVMAITGEKGEWEESYNRLINENNYAEISTLHEKRLKALSAICHRTPAEGMMYGDHIVAVGAFWLLITLEENEELRETYRKGLRTWNGTIRREHNPIYDFMFMLSCPDDEIDTGLLCDWFRRQNVSNLAASVNVTNRDDVKCIRLLGGNKETSKLLMPDERPIAKYDRNPYDYLDEDVSNGTRMIESCYVYTTAYWLGKFYGLIEDEF